MRARILISGRVQGVWFRDACSDQARVAGVAGWVRNRADGRVEAELEGTPAGVARVIEWCHEGPPRARVDDLQVEWLEPRGERGFRIR